MTIIFSEDAWKEYIELQNTNSKPVIKKINELIKEIQRKGLSKGMGQPEPLKHNYAGYWSRRITQEHRLVYTMDENKNLIIIKCMEHYDD
ncbi:MAG: Txe/YoeB family addiction module toxin [Methanimicrococcus sp.]|nr:Txe/YoeB family addiction module toxin [Methanimicrococcus sp.]